jgi:membrane protein YdbS with pleckstrin-like domain
MDEDEEIRVDMRRHGVVLVRPFARALFLALCGAGAFLGGWPLSVAGGVLLALAAITVMTAVWRWDRTHVVLTNQNLFVAHGLLRRRAASVQLARVGAVEVDQSLPGRVFGYGTVVAGDLEIRAVPKPRQFARILQ